MRSNAASNSAASVKTLGDHVLVVLRPTHKLRSSLPTMAVSTQSDTALGDWYVNRIVVQRQSLLLLVSSTSLAPTVDRSVLGIMVDFAKSASYYLRIVDSRPALGGAETALRQALRIAREQQAQGFELRVAASLDRLQAAKSSQPSER